MKNKNKHGLFMALLATFSTITSGGMAYLSLASSDTLANLFAIYQPSSSYERCAELSKKIFYTTDYTSDDKYEYEKLCLNTSSEKTEEQNTSTKEDYSKKEDTTYIKPDFKPSAKESPVIFEKPVFKEIKEVEKESYTKKPEENQDNNRDTMCIKLKDALSHNDYTEKDKATYENLCNKTQTTTTETSPGFCAKMEKAFSANGEYSADEKLAYYKVCRKTEDKQEKENYQPEENNCKDLRSKLVKQLNDGQGDSESYSKLKTEFSKICTFMPIAFNNRVSTKCEANPFPDINSESLEGKAACELYKRGVLGGYQNGEFRGENPVNRAEAAKFLLLACNKKDQGKFSGKFKDIKSSEWYSGYIEAAAEQGIINGYKDGTFKPGNTVNRAEFLKMITKACGLTEVKDDNGDFTDVKSNKDWFANYARAAKKYNLIPEATQSGRLDADKLMSRRDLAKAIYQFLANRPETETSVTK